MIGVAPCAPRHADWTCDAARHIAMAAWILHEVRFGEEVGTQNFAVSGVKSGCMAMTSPSRVWRDCALVESLVADRLRQGCLVPRLPA